MFYGAFLIQCEWCLNIFSTRLVHITYSGLHPRMCGPLNMNVLFKKNVPFIEIYRTCFKFSFPLISYIGLHLAKHDQIKNCILLMGTFHNLPFKSATFKISIRPLFNIYNVDILVDKPCWLSNNWLYVK